MKWEIVGKYKEQLLTQSLTCQTRAGSVSAAYGCQWSEDTGIYKRMDGEVYRSIWCAQEEDNNDTKHMNESAKEVFKVKRLNILHKIGWKQTKGKETHKQAEELEVAAVKAWRSPSEKIHNPANS